jgi:hypothetical protein
MSAIGHSCRADRRQPRRLSEARQPRSSAFVVRDLRDENSVTSHYANKDRLILAEFPIEKWKMAKKTIRSVAGLTRAWAAATRKARRFYERPYIFQPALIQNLARFDELNAIEDERARFQAFRQIPALEYDLEAVNSDFTDDERKSLAQRDRAKHPRALLTPDGASLRDIIRDLIIRCGNPWKFKAKQYWNPLIEQLRELGLNPHLVSNRTRGGVECLRYGPGDRPRYLSSGHFHNIISRVRKRLRSEMTASG